MVVARARKLSNVKRSCTGDKMDADRKARVQQLADGRTRRTGLATLTLVTTFAANGARGAARTIAADLGLFTATRSAAGATGGLAARTTFLSERDGCQSRTKKPA